MAQNYISCGDVLEYVNTTGAVIASGAPVVVGTSLVAIALGTIGVAGEGRVSTEGIYQVDKTAALAIGQGDKVYWNTSTKKVSKTATDVFMGYASTAADGADSVVNVKLSDDGNPAGKAATVAAVATANGSDAATTQALANQLKTTVNAILTSLKDAGLMA